MLDRLDRLRRDEPAVVRPEYGHDPHGLCLVETASAGSDRGTDDDRGKRIVAAADRRLDRPRAVPVDALLTLEGRLEERGLRRLVQNSLERWRQCVQLEKRALGFEQAAARNADAPILGDCLDSLGTEDLADLRDLFGRERAPILDPSPADRFFGREEVASGEQRSQRDAAGRPAGRRAPASHPTPGSADKAAQSVWGKSRGVLCPHRLSSRQPDRVARPGRAQLTPDVERAQTTNGKQCATRCKCWKKRRLRPVRPNCEGKLLNWRTLRPIAYGRHPI